MPIANINDIISASGYDYPIVEKIENYLDEAENLLRKWIGKAKYVEVSADASHDYYSKVKKAEALLAYALALPTLNLRPTERGGHVKNLGLDQMGNSNFLMGKRELDSYGRDIRARARGLVRELLIASRRVTRPEANNLST